jgi:hypothetical protein
MGDGGPSFGGCTQQPTGGCRCAPTPIGVGRFPVPPRLLFLFAPMAAFVMARVVWETRKRKCEAEVSERE